ncbi:MAG: thermonuclease family protein [Rhodoplanes sp.]|uniref:thermonuclease family protein n=1 Tax=Rhodoplanes sp. TaxID=1968906 RepID=UPI0017A4B02F|nr:thermonuclease family protein [Rhodoplanes sp.]NVO15991.1 thermonuclease family protein [Rhodoplanes sp.]
MVRVHRNYSFRPRSRGSSVLVSLLVALALLGVAALKSWWDGVPASRPAPPSHADLRGAPSRMDVDVLYVVDGDTFDARIHVGGERIVTGRVRLRGIDAPELHAQCEAERVKAEAARDLLRRLLAEGGVAISSPGEEKYGRVLADVATRKTTNVSAALIAAGVARPYDGGHRFGWCGRG